jgi:hypothetical protein
MAKNTQPQAPAPTAEPAPMPGIRESLRALTPSASHASTARHLGQHVEQLIHQADSHLVDAINSLRQLESTAGGVGADKIRAVIERLQ